MFAFDTVRTFRRVDIHTNNHFTKDIQIFKQAKIYFSNEEDKFGDDRYVDFKYMPDLSLENARNVSINLKGEHGQFVMVQLFFSAKWLLISEVTFYSEPKTETPFTTPDGVENIFDTKGLSKVAPEDEEDIYANGDGNVNNNEADNNNNKNNVVDVQVEAAPIDDVVNSNDHRPGGRFDDSASDEEGPKTVGIVIGVLLTVIFLLIMGILYVVHRAKRLGKRATPTHSLLAASTRCPAPGPADRFSNSIDFKDHQHLMNMQYTPYNNHTGSTSLLDNSASKQTSYEETIYEDPLPLNNNGSRNNNLHHYLSTEDCTDEYAEPGGLLASSSFNENIYAQAMPPSHPPALPPPSKKTLPPLPLSHYARPLSPPPGLSNGGAKNNAPPPPPPLQSLVLPPPPPPTAGTTGTTKGGSINHMAGSKIVPPGDTSATSSLAASSTRSPPAELRAMMFRDGLNTTMSLGHTPVATSSSTSSSSSPNGRFNSATTVGNPLDKRRPSKSSKSSRTSTLKKKDSTPYYASNDVTTAAGSLELSKLYAQVNKTTAEAAAAGPFKRSTSIDTVNVTINEIDRRSLKVVERLGEGQFGEIHLCRIDNTSTTAAATSSLHMRLVAVKSLRKDCDESSRYVMNLMTTYFIFAV